jgi:hypothetical protein
MTHTPTPSVKRRTFGVLGVLTRYNALNVNARTYWGHMLLRSLSTRFDAQTGITTGPATFAYSPTCGQRADLASTRSLLLLGPFFSFLFFPYFYLAIRLRLLSSRVVQWRRTPYVEYFSNIAI